MPLWGTIWWKKAKRLLEFDQALQAPTYFDMLAPPHACQTYGDILSMHIFKQDKSGHTVCTVHERIHSEPLRPAEESKPEPQSHLWCKISSLKHFWFSFQKHPLLGSFMGQNVNTWSTVHKAVGIQFLSHQTCRLETGVMVSARQSQIYAHAYGLLVTRRPRQKASTAYIMQIYVIHYLM